MVITINRSQRTLQSVSLQSHYHIEEETEVQVCVTIYQNATSAHCQSGKCNWIFEVLFQFLFPRARLIREVLSAFR